MELSVGKQGFFTFLSACWCLWPPVAHIAPLCVLAPWGGSTSSPILSSVLPPLQSKTDFKSFTLVAVNGGAQLTSLRREWARHVKAEEGEEGDWLLEGYFWLRLQPGELNNIILSVTVTGWGNYFMDRTGLATCSQLVIRGILTNTELKGLCSNFFPVVT